MPHFPRFAAQQQSPMDLGTLLSLLADPQATKEAAKSSYHPARVPSFSPKFDVFETSKDYVLEGELPGLQDKKKIDIEFTDPQTLVIRGRIEKHVEEAKPAAQSIEEKPQVAEDKPATTEEKTPSRPHTPPRPVTVEDSPDDDDFEHLTSQSTSSEVQKPKEKAVSKENAPAQQPQKPKQQEKPQTRYWVSERAIGNFQRTFNFPGFIDQEAVTAKLDNGILTIVVPKRQKSAIRKVEIL
jgi:HSP20 family protein